MQTKRPRGSVRTLTTAAATAALYVLLTELSALLGLSGGVIQCRLGEALCVLPVFTPAAIPGLFIGCILSNFLTGALPYDILFGSLATLVGAYGAHLLRKAPPLAVTLPTLVANTVTVPLLLRYTYGVAGGLFALALPVFLGEAISATLLGTLFYGFLKKYQKYLKL